MQCDKNAVWRLEYKVVWNVLKKITLSHMWSDVHENCALIRGEEKASIFGNK